VTFVNRHNETGIVVRPRDPVSLTRGINKLLEDPDLGASMGKKARSILESEFRKEDMAKKTLNLHLTA
ncbi:MAG TPA: glycosyltransferase family 1 protein, partial [Candidatus Omnitrophota bacterium]|nr:glycosyltransferase family 1 protein [Candidatus Omnitrophota bacterium]